MEMCIKCGTLYQPGQVTCTKCGRKKSRRIKVKIDWSPDGGKQPHRSAAEQVKEKSQVQSKRHLLRPTFIVEVVEDKQRSIRKVKVKAHELDDIVKNYRSEGWMVERVLSGEIFPFLGGKDALMVIFKKERE